MLESLHVHAPHASMHLAVRKGNESLFSNHPFVEKVVVWDKKGGKYKALLQTLGKIRNERYDLVLNLQRYASSGLLTAFSGAKQTRGFSKNPLSIFFSKRYEHNLGKAGDEVYAHEIDRNHRLIVDFAGEKAMMPRIYPPKVELPASPYVVIAPASVWYTKQFPAERWVELVDALTDYHVVFVGASGDRDLVDSIVSQSVHADTANRCGELTMLESAALMRDAAMTYCNDSAPLHFCSAVNAPVTAIFCSTIPEFGFGPLGEKAHVVQTPENLACRPCGVHGYKACPQKHFACAKGILIRDLLVPLNHG
ncbi:MAG: glycosyltransferase family 9 protein [Cryomorphaceae bacterium]|nr:glycosyltransferase family 9 protein [Cryomorphaceae bacterium]